MNCIANYASVVHELYNEIYKHYTKIAHYTNVNKYYANYNLGLIKYVLIRICHKLSMD